MKNYLNFNGKLIPETAIKLESTNRGFLFGDGFFETLRVKRGKALYFKDHFQRLTAGMALAKLKFTEEFTESSLQNAVQEIATANNLEDARIKLLVWRKPGGLFIPEKQEAEFLISATGFKKAIPFKNTVVFAKSVFNTASVFSRFKTLSTLKYIAAAIELQELEADEIIITDTKGNISECLSSNIFWIRADVLYTPSLETGCIEGIMRKKLLSFYEKKRNKEVKEGLFGKDVLLSADTVFSSNITGISIFKSIENTVLPKAILPEELRTL